MSTRIWFSILAAVTALHSIPAWSLGLGDARVQSFIGQPLELHIDLLTSPGDNLDSVSARLASAEDFAMIGASREAISVPLNFQVRGDDGSGAYILVTSRLAVSNPIIRLVVEVNWSSGRLLREYTVFLDPPTVPSQAPAPAVSQPETQPVQAQTPVSPPPAVDSTPEPAQSEAPPPAVTADNEPNEVVAEPATADPVQESPSEMVSSASGSQYGPVRNGETLWQIASGHIGNTGLDMNQVMVAIQRKNPNAFVNQNINLLKRGATLDLPSETEMHELSSAEARELVAHQEAAFRMRSSLASTSTPLLASESTSDAVAASTGSGEAETGDADSAADTVSRLEIVPASDEDLAASEAGTGVVPGGEGSDEVEGSIREELARTEEALISAQQENVYLQERIAELEAQLGNTDGAPSEGLIADDELAGLEERLQAERLAENDAEQAEAQPTDSQVPTVTTLEDQGVDRPWYSGPMIWIIMIIIVIAAVVGWLFNRRRAAQHYDLNADLTASPVSGLKDEAEDILRALDTDPGDSAEAEFHSDDTESVEPATDDADRLDADDPDEDQGPDSSPVPDAKPAAEQSDAEPRLSRQRQRDDHGDATVLDENSSDPEIQLDLARAYISMGDKEAARAILDEVQNLGNEAQKSEAREMLEKI